MDFAALADIDYSRIWDGLTTEVGGTILVVGALILIGRGTGWFLKRITTAALETSARSQGHDLSTMKRREATLHLTISWTVNTFFAFLVVASILTALGLDIAALFAAAGVIGIAIGFGAQAFVRDIINGMFILLEDQYGIGDVVAIADVAGEVIEINPRRTLLRDLDGNVHSVPNGSISRTTNMTRGFSRINVDFSVAYEEDLAKVIATINEACERFAKSEQAHILGTPKVLRVNGLGNSGIEIKVTGDVLPGTQWDLMGKLRQEIKATFDEKGIEIPYPHQVNVLKKAKAATGV